MAFKFVSLLAFVVIASAGVIPVTAPVPTAIVKTVAPIAYTQTKPILDKYHDDQYDPRPQYKYAYEINDKHTGDNHSQQEERDGDIVHGEYTLIEPDGFRRVVQYTVDPISGFNAIVNRIPLNEHVKSIVKTVDAPTHVAPVTANAVIKEYPVPVTHH